MLLNEWMSKGGGLQAFYQPGWITECLQWTRPFGAGSWGLLMEPGNAEVCGCIWVQCLESAWFPWVMLLHKWIILFKRTLRALTAPWGRSRSIAPVLKCKSGLNWVSHCVGLEHPGHPICCSWLCLQILEYLNLNLWVIFFSCSLFCFFSFKLLLSILILVPVNLIPLLQAPYITA